MIRNNIEITIDTLEFDWILLVSIQDDINKLLEKYSDKNGEILQTRTEILKENVV